MTVKKRKCQNPRVTGFVRYLFYPAWMLLHINRVTPLDWVYRVVFHTCLGWCFIILKLSFLPQGSNLKLFFLDISGTAIISRQRMKAQEMSLHSTLTLILWFGTSRFFLLRLCRPIQLCYDICQTNWIWKAVADDLGHHIGSRLRQMCLRKKREFSLVCFYTLAFHVWGLLLEN